MKFIKMTYELSLELNQYIDSLIKEFALFDSNFSDEFLYYESDKSIQNDIINNYLYLIEDNNNYIGYIVLNIFKDGFNRIGCNINPIIVFEEYRNNGYGNMILQESFIDIVKEDIKYLEATIDILNIASYKIFIKNDFKEYNRKDNFIYLRKEL